jgi:hypothetical protein
MVGILNPKTPRITHPPPDWTDFWARSIPLGEERENGAKITVRENNRSFSDFHDNIGKFVILRYDKKFFTEYAKLTARKSSKSL